MPQMRPPLHHLRTHRRNSLHGHQERWPPRTLRAPKDSARLAQSLREAPGSYAETGIHRRRNRRRGPRSHRARTHHHRNRRNDHAPPQKARQSSLRALRQRLHGFQGRPGIYVRTKKSPEGSRQEMTLARMRKPSTMAFLFLSVLLVASLAAQNRTASGGAAAAIDPEKIRAHVKFLASDLLEGRGTGQRGGDIAAEYIATQFELDGLKPGAEDGTYFQNVPMMSVKTLPDTSFKLVPATGEAMTLKNLDDFVTNNESQTQTADIDAPIVFVGYGITAPEYNWDDYKGVDLKGKVALLFVNEPISDDTNFFKGKALTYYGRWTYKFVETARRGAVATLIIHRTDLASYGWQVVRNSMGTERSHLRPGGTPKLQAASWIQFDVAKKLVAMDGLDLDKLFAQSQSRDFKPIELPVHLQ